MSDIRERLKQAIFGQESNHGKTSTAHINEHGVTGPMQVQDKTFEGLKKNGIIPADWVHTNPEHNKAAGFAHIDDLFNKFNDPALVAAAYYAGEKAINKDGTFKNFRDLKNPNAPDTNRYVREVLQRAGLDNGIGAGASKAVAQAEAVELPDLSKPLMQRGRFVPTQGKAPKEVPSIVGPGLAVENPQALIDQTAAAADASRAISQGVADSTLGSRVEAAFLDTFTGALGRKVIDATVREHFPDVPGFTPDPKKMEGRSQEEIDELLDARSPQAEARTIFEQDERRARAAQAGKAGVGHALVASLVAGGPEALLTGFGAFRALSAMRVGSAQLAAQGRTGAAIASNAAENAGLNVAMTTVQDAVDGYMGPADYAVGAGLGSLGTFAALPGINRAARLAAAQASSDAAVAQTVAKAEAAAVKLGPMASKEEVIAEMRRADVAEHTANEAAGTAPVAASRRLDTADITQADLPAATPLPWGSRLGNNWAHMDPEMQRARLDATAPERAQLDEASAAWGGWAGLQRLAPGSHFQPDVPPAVRKVVDAVQRSLLVDQAVAVTMRSGAASNGGAISFPNGVHIDLSSGRDPAALMHTTIHELGHAVFNRWYTSAPTHLQKAIKQFHLDWQQRYVTGETRADRTLPPLLGARADAALDRSLPTQLAGLVGLDKGPKAKFSMFNWLAGQVDAAGKVKPTATPDGKALTYWPNIDEMGAEQFVKWIEATTRGENQWKPKGGIPEELVNWVKDIWAKLTQMFTWAKDGGYLNADTSFQDFFAWAQTANGRTVSKAGGETGDIRQASLSNDPVAIKHGLNFLPEATDLQRAEKLAVIELYRKADNPDAPWNNIDPKFIGSITDNSVFNVASSSLRLLKSENPVARMVAAELLESPTGAAGRHSTAAISKFRHERKFMGNAVNDFQTAYKLWRNENGGNIAKDAFDGEHWLRFNRLVAEHIESLGKARQVSAHPAVAKAAAVMQAGYERMRAAQVEAKTAGWASLPDSSVGYMPHRMSAARVRQMTPQETGALHGALVDQFVQIEGWDISFSTNLASKYIERVRGRAVGEHDVSVNIHQVGASDIVEDALTAMGMSRDEVRAAMERYMRAAPGHTKRRIRLDLNEEHGDGFKLMDLFETDQLTLLRSQAQRVSGEVALTRHGVMGKSGLKVLRHAMGLGEKRAGNDALEAFDQVAAEFLGEPFGNQNGKFLDRAIQFNALARLGGMGFTQLAEYINGVVHVGAARTLAAFGSMRRLRAEIIAMAKGQQVDNPLLKSLESFGGAEFGTDSYKLVFPFDNHAKDYQIYGRDTVTMADRLLRGGAHAQAKLSFWRAIHSAQQRGFAEQIVHKAVRYIKEGGNDKALADMGFTPELTARLRGEMAGAATFEGGRLVGFDVTRIRSKEDATAFVDAVHRGVGQIIQGTFIGETGRWIHSDLLRLITQFRGFSITAVEKQWGRQVANRGTMTALGILLGSMSMAAPIYMARVALASVGREDQDAYLEAKLDPAAVARATLNYVALSGLAGDLLDALSTVSGAGSATGGRAGQQSDFVGSVAAPSLGLVDDVWQAMQNSKDGTDPTGLLRTLPFSKLPYLTPLINSLGD